MEENKQELAVSKQGPMTAVEIRKQVNLIQQVMREVMVEGEHYGVIPGCKKKSLFKPGGEKLAMTFRLGARYEELPGSVESDNFINYKIDCELFHILTGQVVGHGRGTCNSKEKKYRTRMVYANKATEEEKVIGKKETRQGDKGKYDVYIVPQDPWDVQNTIYKMACKRALIAAILNATAASDIFTQDIEDLPEGTVIDEENMAENHKPPVEMPKEKVVVKQEKPAEQKVVEKTFNAEEVSKELNVLEALEQPVGATFDMWGILFDFHTRNVKTKKGPSDVTDYKLNPRESTTLIEVSKFGKPIEGVSNGDTLVLRKVVVSVYNESKKYLAKEIEILAKGEDNAGN